jgi:hypothetical protein
MVRSSLDSKPTAAVVVAIAAPAPAATGSALAGSCAGLCLQQLLYVLVVLLGSAGSFLVMALGFGSKGCVLQGTAGCMPCCHNCLLLLWNTPQAEALIRCR